MGSLVLLYLVTGAFIGGIAVWFTHQPKFRQAEERLEAAAESARQAFGKFNEEKELLNDEIQVLNSELSDGQREVSRLEGEFAAVKSKLATLSGVLEKTHVEFKEMSNKLLVCEEDLSGARLDNARLPQLEQALARKEAEMAGLHQRIAELDANREALARELAEEKRSLDECVIFVEGSHYLPGRVVRSLVETAKAS